MKKLIVGIVLVLFSFLFLIAGSDLGEVLPIVIVFLISGGLLIWFGWKDCKKRPATAILPVSAPSSQNDDNFAKQCLNPQFREQPESRTWKSDPEFSKVLDPLNSGNNDLACREAEKLIGKISDFDTLYDWWGTALLRKRAFDQARQVLRQGLDKSRRKYSLCKVLGEVEWNAGNIQQAIYWWTQALHSQELLERYGADEGAYLYLHYVADGIGFSDIARALISRVDQIRGGQVRLNPPTAENLRSLSRKGKTSGIERVLKELGAKYLDQKKAKTPQPISVATTATASSEKLCPSTQVKQPAKQMPVHFWKPIIEEAKDKRQLVNSWEPDTRGWVRADAEAVIISGASRFSFIEKWLGLGPIGKVFILTLFESIRQKERNVPYFSIFKMVATWRPHRSSFWDSGDTECGIIHVLFEKNGGKREICAFSTDISNTDLQAFWKYCSERVGANKLEIRDEKMAHILSNSAKSNESSGGIINEQISDSQSLQADVSKKYGDILRKIDKMLDQNGEDPHSWFLRGEALHYLGRNEEAKYSFDQALKRDPENEAIKQFRSKNLSAMSCSENIGNDLILVKNGLWECKNCHIEMLLAGDFCSKCRGHKKDIAIRKE